MYNISIKYKQFLPALLKIAIVGGALYFIYQQLKNSNRLSVSELVDQLAVLFSINIWAIVLLLLFTDANWFLEILKWKSLTSRVQKITFFDAYRQCLASLTVSLITPNKIGEYGAKALYFEKGQRKKIMLLNLLGNMSQLAITLFFGCIGILFFFYKFNAPIPALNLQKGMLLLVLIAFIIVFRKKLQLQKIRLFFKEIPTTIYQKIIGLSLLKYLVFSHQFYFLLILFGVDIDYLSAINILFCMYLIASVLPGLTVFDWAVKGSIAVWLFQFAEINELVILTITTLMWLLNFAIPALLGSIFVINFKIKSEV